MIKLAKTDSERFLSSNIPANSFELTCVGTGTDIVFAARATGLTSRIVGAYAVPAMSVAGDCTRTALPFCKVNIISGTADGLIIIGAGLLGNAVADGNLTAAGAACGE